MQHISTDNVDKRARIWAKGTRLPRKFVIAFVLFMIFEGVVRKWMFPSLGTLLQVVRDALPTLALLTYIFGRPSPSVVNSLLVGRSVLVWLVMYTIYAVITTIISGQLSVPVALLGLRTHFAYVPLAFLIPVLLPNMHVTKKFLFRAAVVSIPICLLAIYQSTQPSSSWINIYGSGEEASASFGDQSLIRASGTFSYITAMGYFAQFSAITSFLLLMMRQEKKELVYSAIAFAIATLSCFSTGSRGVVYGLIAQVLIIIILCPLVGRKIFNLIRRNMLLVIISSCLILYLGNAQIGAFFERTRTVSGDTGSRVALSLFEWIDIVAQFPMGTGLGSGHQQAALFTGGIDGFDANKFLPESELSRVAMELGVIGFFMFCMFRLCVFAYSLSAVLRARQYEEKLLAAYAFSFFILLVAGGIYSPISNCFYWSSLGLVTMVRINTRLELSRNAHTRVA